MEFTIEYPTKEDFVKMDERAIAEFGTPDEDMVAPTLEK